MLVPIRGRRLGIPGVGVLRFHVGDSGPQIIDPCHYGDARREGPPISYRGI
jgi:hypothetical protein